MNDAAILLSFVAGADWSSGEIRWFGAGYFSHVDVIIEDQLWGARSDRIGGKVAGVQGRPNDYEKWLHRTIFALPCTTLQQQSYYAFVKSQEGKPYDWRAILAFGAGRNWRKPDSWICSELQAAAGESADIWGMLDAQGARQLFLATNRITPGMLAMLVSGKNGAKITVNY
jgi:hypothetical protein